jgi:thioredoxin 1
MKVFKFYAEWCGPCKGLSMVIKGMGDNLPMQVVDVNIDENIALAQEFKVRSVPTMIVVDDNENEIRRKVGTMDEANLLKFLKGE